MTKHQFSFRKLPVSFKALHFVETTVVISNGAQMDMEGSA
jgi:hypothetical protein